MIESSLFVIRHKDNLAFSTVKERELPENTAQLILKDEKIELTSTQSKMKYHRKLKRVAVRMIKTSKPSSCSPTTQVGCSDPRRSLQITMGD
ncbi:hypothetical protein SAMN03080598_03778 [Algoriphagus boritolerans DSM 17298 = JCM 18970]|uniref:Uncharacterized protein n=2 Tax=Algoriphagus TaxID=246875 RepID=A0A1H5ZWE7_9BACT|nr:hypothetical protein SAMN03080598_03778 [Algoriphagus boritolerans DSM 17298 = JCM 18970]